MYRAILISIGIIMMIVEAYLIHKTFTLKKPGYVSMVKTLISGFCVTLFYFVSILTRYYFVMSLFSSLYFCANSFACYHLLDYFSNYTRTKRMRLPISRILLFLDCIVLMINPFHEISMNYEDLHRSLASWEFHEKPLYNVHLGLCYIFLAHTIAMLVGRAIKKPSVYRAKYTTIIIGLLACIAANGIYLFIPQDGNIDFAVFMYCGMSILLCWNSFNYEKSRLLTNIRGLILDELGHPVVLFDESEHMVTCNHPGEFLIGTTMENQDFTLEEFIRANRFDLALLDSTENTYFQWTTDLMNRQITYRVDCHVLKDKKQRIIGRLFVFTDNSLEIDVLTGFHSKNSFEHTFQMNQYSDDGKRYCVAICDINRLSVINRNVGEEIGDEIITLLSTIMKKNCPVDSYFARLSEANLLVVIPNMEVSSMREIMKKLREEFQASRHMGLVLDMQSAIAATSDENPSVIDAADLAAFSMKSKKLMDRTSVHSSLLDSLAMTLMESDSTTEAHVLRTKEMGEALGIRLGLTDVQLSNLGLLCLLHDIGKLGVPLEILNKPSKLNDAEWDIMKSHTEKGYRIAKASKELEGIADFILHHHEAWNGRGYPDGLKGESIPLLSRIIAVVDSYDAMTNDRPYHMAMPEWAAREELRRCSGTQFDPLVVSEYLDMLDELRPAPKPANAELEKKENEPIPRGVGLALDEKKTSSETIIPVKTSTYYLNAQSEVIHPDSCFEELTGYSPEDVKTYRLTLADLLPFEDREEYIQIVTEGLSKGPNMYLEHRLLRKDGAIRYVLCYGKQSYIASVPGAVSEVTITDIAMTHIMNETVKRERQTALRNIKRWEENSRKDSLTGILNHEAFINDVEMQLLNQNHEVLLIILDVDYFKTYNDTYGHMAGDEMLSMVAKMLSEGVGEQGVAGRLGGDEFAAGVLIPKSECENPERRDEYCRRETERIWNTISKVITTMPESATISMGSTISSDDRKSFSKLYKLADHSLYQAKEQGRNGYFFE